MSQNNTTDNSDNINKPSRNIVVGEGGPDFFQGILTSIKVESPPNGSEDYDIGPNAYPPSSLPGTIHTSTFEGYPSSSEYENVNYSQYYIQNSLLPTEFNSQPRNPIENNLVFDSMNNTDSYRESFSQPCVTVNEDFVSIKIEDSGITAQTNNNLIFKQPETSNPSKRKKPIEPDSQQSTPKKGKHKATISEKKKNAREPGVNTTGPYPRRESWKAPPKPTFEKKIDAIMGEWLKSIVNSSDSDSSNNNNDNPNILNASFVHSNIRSKNLEDIINSCNKKESLGILGKYYKIIEKAFEGQNMEMQASEKHNCDILNEFTKPINENNVAGQVYKSIPKNSDPLTCKWFKKPVFIVIQSEKKFQKEDEDEEYIRTFKIYTHLVQFLIILFEPSLHNYENTEMKKEEKIWVKMFMKFYKVLLKSAFDPDDNLYRANFKKLACAINNIFYIIKSEIKKDSDKKYTSKDALFCILAYVYVNYDDSGFDNFIANCALRDFCGDNTKDKMELHKINPNNSKTGYFIMDGLEFQIYLDQNGIYVYNFIPKKPHPGKRKRLAKTEDLIELIKVKVYNDIQNPISIGETSDDVLDNLNAVLGHSDNISDDLNYIFTNINNKYYLEVFCEFYETIARAFGGEKKMKESERWDYNLNKSIITENSYIIIKQIYGDISNFSEPLPKLDWLKHPINEPLIRNIMKTKFNGKVVEKGFSTIIFNIYLNFVQFMIILFDKKLHNYENTEMSESDSFFVSLYMKFFRVMLINTYNPDKDLFRTNFKKFILQLVTIFYTIVSEMKSTVGYRHNSSRNAIVCMLIYVYIKFGDSEFDNDIADCAWNALFKDNIIPEIEKTAIC